MIACCPSADSHRAGQHNGARYGAPSNQKTLHGGPVPFAKRNQDRIALLNFSSAARLASQLGRSPRGGRQRFCSDPLSSEQLKGEHYLGLQVPLCSLLPRHMTSGFRCKLFEVQLGVLCVRTSLLELLDASRAGLISNSRVVFPIQSFG